MVGKQNDPQALGAAISYSRRYGLQSMVNVGAEDDDAEAAMGRNVPKAKTVETKQTETKVTEEVAPPKKTGFGVKAKVDAATVAGPDDGWS